LQEVQISVNRSQTYVWDDLSGVLIDLFRSGVLPRFLEDLENHTTLACVASLFHDALLHIVTRDNSNNISIALFVKMIERNKKNSYKNKFGNLSKKGGIIEVSNGNWVAGLSSGDRDV